MIAILLVGILLIIWLCTSKPTILVIAGTHGNEPAPSTYLKSIHTTKPGINLVIVPSVNPAALAAGTRSVGVDMNRCWPDIGGKYCSPIKDLVDHADLVIDIHEAWGFYLTDPESLGQTIFASDVKLYPLVDRAVSALNLQFCDKWSRIDTLPAPTDGTALDQYCQSNKIPYILIEIAGQRDIVPREIREAQCQVALNALIGI